MAYIVMAYIVMAYIVMAYTVMAYVVMAYIVVAYIVMAYIVMAYIVMAYIVMAPADVAGRSTLFILPPSRNLVLRFRTGRSHRRLAALHRAVFHARACSCPCSRAAVD